MLSYALHVFGEGSAIVGIIMQTLGKAVKEMYVTMADKLRKEGRKEGWAAAQAESVLGVLRHRLGPVPMAVRVRVRGTADERVLQRALTAGSVEDVFEPLGT